MIFRPTLLAGFAAWLLAVKSGDPSVLYGRSLRLHLASSSVDTCRVLRDEAIRIPARIWQHPVVQDTRPLALLNGKSSQYVVKVLPLQISKRDRVVVLIDYVASIDGSEMNLAWVSSETFRYRYDPTKKSYQLVRRKKGTL